MSVLILVGVEKLVAKLTELHGLDIIIDVQSWVTMQNLYSYHL